MTHPLIQRLFDHHGYPRIDVGNHEAFVNREGVNLLFFAGDPARFRETTDVAVVLPELDQAFVGRLRPGVVDAGAETALQQVYGFGVWPTLVFVRAGEYLGAIGGIRNWPEYLHEIGVLLDSPPGHRAPIRIPVVGA